MPIQTHTNILQFILRGFVRTAHIATHIFLGISFLFIHTLPAYAITGAHTLMPPEQKVEPFIFDHTQPVVSRKYSSDIPITPGTVIIATATAYSSEPNQTWGNPFITASGRRVRPGTLAANFLPFGTQVRIGSTVYTVEDRMNSRYNNQYRVDIWMQSTTNARRFGIQSVVMEVVSLP